MAARSKRGTAVAVSVALHLAVLAILALSTPTLHLPTARFAPDIALDLSRPPLLRGERAQPAVAAPRASSIAAAPSPAAAPATPAPATPAGARPSPSASPPTPSPAPSAVTGPAGTAGPVQASAAPGGRDWTVKPEGGDVHGMARAAIGCGHAQYLKLTADEQAACDRRLASLRGTEMPHFDAIPPAKRAYYDAVVAAYAKMHAGTPLPYPVTGDNFGVTERWAGPPGAHPPGFGCKIPFGIPKGWKPRKGGPPHSLKLGLLPCYITPPSGFLTEEADLPDPTDLGPRK